MSTTETNQVPDADEPIHDYWARECIMHGVPVEALRDRPCPACRKISALVDLDPDFGSKEDGRPDLRGDR